jgi:hypothetical protein
MDAGSAVIILPASKERGWKPRGHDSFFTDRLREKFFSRVRVLVTPPSWRLLKERAGTSVAGFEFLPTAYEKSFSVDCGSWERRHPGGF